MVTKKSRAAANVGLMMAAVGSMMAALSFGACNVESTDDSTGGIGQGTGGGGGEGMGGAGGEGTVDCPAGVTVVLSDYVSTQIALSSLAGETLSASFLSSGSTTTDGLAFPLSGDVVVPSSRTASGSVVLLDRSGTNVISWVDPATAEVTAQLEVGTGFESNPQDYLEIGDGLALVTRYGDNTDSGQEDFDAGSDVLVLDLSDAKKPKIVKSVPLPVVEDLPPRPGQMLRVGDQVIVPLERISNDYATTGEAIYVGIDIAEQKVTWQVTLDGLKNCGRPALSPNGTTLAVGCAGTFDPDGNTVLSESALVFFEVEEGQLVETNRIEAESLAGEAIQSRVTYATSGVLLLATQTPWGGATNNRLLAYDIEADEATELLEASPDDMGLGKGLVYSGITCSPGCSDTCLMVDGDEGVLQRVKIASDGSVELLEPIEVEDKVGLPPAGIGPR